MPQENYTPEERKSEHPVELALSLAELGWFVFPCNTE